MSRNFASASSQYLVSSSAPVTATPLSMACWFNVSNVTARQCLMSLCNSGSSANYHRLEAAGDVAGDPIRAGSDAGAGVPSATTSTSYSANTWSHGAAVFASATSRAAYLNGGGKGTNTTSAAPTGMNRAGVGAQVASSIVGFTNGLIAEAAIWNIALSDNDVASLANGISPIHVRPQGLVAYWPLVGQTNPEIDVRAGINLTLTNSPTTGDHPRMYR